MINILDLEGGTHPIPSHGISTGQHIYDLLKDHHSLSRIELYSAQRLIAPDTIIGADILQGTVPVVMVPERQGSNRYRVSPMLNDSQFSADPFTHWTFTFPSDRRAMQVESPNLVTS
jgi:hypothetical protein